jgi:hypothetical protein
VKTNLLLSATLLAVACLAFSGCEKDDPSAAAEIMAQGRAGSLWWVLAVDGTLTISGTGAMPDYRYSSDIDVSSAPWFSYRDDILRVVVEDGITSIGSSAFNNCTALTAATIGRGCDDHRRGCLRRVPIA